MSSRGRVAGNPRRCINIVIMIAVLVLFIGSAISAYAFLSPTDAKSKNEVKRNLRIIGPALFGIGGVILFIGKCIFVVCKGRLSSMDRSDEQGMIHTAQYGTGNCEKSPYNAPSMNNHQNPYTPPQVNQQPDFNNDIAFHQPAFNPHSSSSSSSSSGGHKCKYYFWLKILIRSRYL